MIIAPGQPADLARLLEKDCSFEVTQVATGPFEGPGLGDVVGVPPYRKSYDVDADELAGLINRSDAALLIAWDMDEPVGYVAVAEAWNGYAEIEDIAVASTARRKGVAGHLLDAARDWAVARGLAGLRLETQSNNVGACLLYQRQGFVLGGYDRFLYAAQPHLAGETALFWYQKF